MYNYYFQAFCLGHNFVRLKRQVPALMIQLNIAVFYDCLWSNLAVGRGVIGITLS
jgi:hypothetical protein